MAGKTGFSVQTAQEHNEVSPVRSVLPEQNATPKERLLSLFHNEFQPLYAVLDAAVEPSVLKVLLESKEEYQSLYQGSSGAQLTHFAPYLVRLPKDSLLLETLIQQGWGENWGVYLTSDQPLETLRAHFRNFLMVKMPDGKQVYFRFYDPRVLRAYLPTCTSDEATQFFGPIASYLAEAGEGRRAVRFVRGGEGCQTQLLDIGLKREQSEGAPMATSSAAIVRLKHALMDGAS